MNQSAFDFTKRVRRRDPATSRAAAARAGEFGGDHHAKIMGSLMTQGAGTIYELAERTRLNHVAVARRMSELEELGVARPRQEMRPSPSGRACRVWEAC
jgi:predicted ArsR family transcriptional regulator